MRIISFILILCSSLVKLQAQENYITRNGQISFFSSTPLEDIKAINNEVASVLNRKTGSVQFIVLIKSFQFRKAAMQDHFNGKDYMDSDRYPKAELKGTISNISTVDFTKDGTYPVTVEGTLSMHGVSNKIKTPGNIIVKGSNVTAAAVFTIRLADYKISVPTIVSKKIADKVEVTVNCNYQLYQPKTN
jgi:polyisoprenoid-binding protein YceI